MLNEYLIHMRQNPLVVMYSHFGVVQLYGDQIGKQLLQDQ